MTDMIHARLLRTYGVQALNSLTKYPSILTYHALGTRGRLEDTVQVPFPKDALLFRTEKIHGANARILLFPDGSYILGSREDFLYASGDLLHVPTQGIVDAIRATGPDWLGALGEAVCANTNALVALLGEKTRALWARPQSIIVVYGEAFGSRESPASKNYTAGKEGLLGFRVFDAWSLSAETEERHAMLSKSPEEIARWRDANMQPWWDEEKLQAAFGSLLTPRIATYRPLPTGLKETSDWLKEFSTRSDVTLHPDASGTPEGLVVRTADRRVIAKIRHEDYQRTLRSLTAKGEL